MTELKKINTLNSVQIGVYKADVCVFSVRELEKVSFIEIKFEETGKKVNDLKFFPGKTPNDNRASILEALKCSRDNHKVCHVTIRVKENTKLNTIEYVIEDAECTDIDSKLEEKKAFSIDNSAIEKYKSVYTATISQIQNEKFKTLLTKLILDNDLFFKWKAAKNMHHAFEGGLAMHSLNVCNNAVNMANLYNNSHSAEIDFDLIMTGALLHDIGKLQEYKENGDYAIIGNLLGHMILGIEEITRVCDECGIDKNDKDIINLKHIIASHHGTKEFGSPVTPILIEAYIVAQADLADAKIEIALNAYDVLDQGEISDKNVSGLDSKVYRE